MKFNRRTNTIILWIISIGLLVGMIITFTPTLGRMGGSRSSAGQGKTELLVNGEPIKEVAVARLRQNPLFTTVTEGQVGQDLELLLTDTLIQNQLLAQAAAKYRVGGGEVGSAVNDFRKARGVDGRGNDQAYLNLIGSAGYTDATFRDYLRQTLQERKYEDALTKDVTVSDAEVQAWFDTHPSDYQSEEQITAREIVVDDAMLAAELQQRAVDGEDFAALAKQNSKELADREGALGAAEGSTTPQPVGRPALPTAVADAAFGLQGPGITNVVSANGRFYVVQVEAYQPAATRPFADVKDQVKEDALKAKKGGVVQAELEKLRQEATITVPEGSSLSYEDAAVAHVGDATITSAELDRATYTNPQIQQALSPQSADLVLRFFKPAVLGQLIDTEVAYQGAQKLGLELVGTKQMVAQAALNYVSKDASATQDELQTYYDNNTASYTIPAEAVATRVDFTGEADAKAFRQALLDGAATDAAAKDAGGTVSELGTVKPGDLETALDTALFQTDAFTALPTGPQQVSDVLVVSQPADAAGANGSGANGSGAATNAADAASPGASSGASSGADPGNAAGDAGSAQPATTDAYVVLVATRTPERVRGFDEVKAQVEASVLSTKRQDLRSQWLDTMRADIPVENLLSQAQPDVNPSAGNGAGAAPAAPADAAPAAPGAAGSGGGDGAATPAPPADGSGSGSVPSGDAGAGPSGSGN